MEQTLEHPSIRPPQPTLHVGAPPKNFRVNSSTLKAVLTGVGIAVAAAGLISSFGWVTTAPITAAFSGASHVIDRAKNHVIASDELQSRAAYYSAQIFRNLQISPAPGRVATVDEFKEVAELFPHSELAKRYHAPLNKKSDENRESLWTNTGIAVAGALVPGGGLIGGAAEASKVMIETGHAIRIAKGMLPTIGLLAGGAAGTALAKVFSHEIADPQMLLETMESMVDQAREQGLDVGQVIHPQLMFALRVSQNEGFAKEIKNRFGGGKVPFHQMDDQTQKQVMHAYPALARAVTNESRAVAMGISMREIGASEPNLQSRAVPTRAAHASFTEQLGPQRQPAASHRDAVDARRTLAAQELNTISG